MAKKITKPPFKKLLTIGLIFALGIAVGYGYFSKNQHLPTASVLAEKNTPKAFVSEVYDKIKDNYWNNISDAELLDLFKLSIDKNGGLVTVPKFESKKQMLDVLPKATTGMNKDDQNKFLASVVGSVLATLAPAGRSGLYTQKQEQQLNNTVANINPQKDLYKDLGVAKGASAAAVAKAYQEKADQLASDSSQQAKDQLKAIAYAKDTLTKPDTKAQYDQNKVEPTIFASVIEPETLYIQFKKFSPTSLDEFQKAFEDNKANANLTSTIIDLRGNIGGAIDATAYFLGFFLGKNQTAFEFYHKGDYLPFKTPTDKLASIQKFKQVVVLIDQNTQSSAELMAAAFKKFHIGVLVGVPTKGWGTVEKVFPLDNQISTTEKYSIFLVHSITLRDDNQPIEGRGVDPDISIKDPNWQQNLLQYFRNTNLVDAVKSVSF